jgi:hypothetical protein
MLPSFSAVTHRKTHILLHDEFTLALIASRSWLKCPNIDRPRRSRQLVLATIAIDDSPTARVQLADRHA